jgi:Ion channel
MLTNLALGSLLIAITVLIQTFGLIALSAVMPFLIKWFRLHRHDIGRTLAMVTTVLGLFALHTIEIWAWAVLFRAIGAIGDFEGALYFSTATFSTVGASGVAVHPGWRLLASLEGINGFILIGWSIAYLVAASTRHGPFRYGEHF